MKRQVVKDEFFDRQPPFEFVELLRRPVHESAPARFARKEARADEVLAEGLYLDTSFPDPKGLLETAYEDFARFLSVCKIGGKRYPIVAVTMDISHILVDDSVKAEDEVLLIKDNHHLDEVAAHIHGATEEAICALNKRVYREYILD